MSTATAFKRESAVNGLLKHDGPTIHATTDYGRFKFDKVNRPLDWNHVQVLYDAIAENNMLADYPIVVSKSYEVLDGQHRLKAAEALGVPIYYVISDAASVLDIAKANARTRGWSVDNYLHYYCEMGAEHYLAIREYMDKYPFMTLTSTIRALGGGDGSTAKFKEGLFEAKRPGLARQLAECTLSLEPYAPDFYQHMRLQMAILNLLLNPNEYDHERLLQKLEYLSTRFVKCPDTESYIAMIDDIYNYKTRERVRLEPTPYSEQANRWD